ncbi:hypothetical protein GF407_13755 [candidate division KSB1 bacterium]|nr:hypothetical protein [candidate division KSB1 bacterium]
MMRIIIPALVLCSISLHCGSSIPTPIPNGSRISCLILPLDDKTGIYDKLDQKLEDKLAEFLRHDFFVTHINENTPGFDKKIYKTNLFLPLRTPQSGDQIDKSVLKKMLMSIPVDWVLAGTVEKIGYNRTRGLLILYSFKIFHLREKRLLYRFQINISAALDRNNPSNTLNRVQRRAVRQIIAELEKAAAIAKRSPKEFIRYR